MEQMKIDEQKRLRQEIGTVLRSWMKANDISPTEVANRLEVSTAYVSALFAGKTIGKKVAKKLHDEFGLSESYLLTGKGLIDDIITTTTQSDAELMSIHQQVIQKANRIHRALGHLVDEGEIENIMAVAPVLGVLPSVVSQSMKYDPNGRYDYVILRLVEHYPQFSLEWLLTGDGQMITYPKSFNEEIIMIKEELAQARTELRQARDEFRDATYRLTQALQNIQEQKSVNTGFAAEP
jgi:transcriptional regulator with XRE-family HTH domain